MAEPMLLQQEGSGVRSVVESAMREGGLRDRDLHVAMELGLQQSVKAAVLDGFGITVISRLAVEREVAEGEPGGADASRGPGSSGTSSRSGTPGGRPSASRRRSSSSPGPSSATSPGSPLDSIRPAYWKHRSGRLGSRGAEVA